MKKKLAALLCLVVMATSLGGCGSKLTGEWAMDIDISGMLNGAVEEDGELGLAGYLHYEQLLLPSVVSFAPGGIYTVTVPEEGRDELLELCRKQTRDSLEKYVQDYLKANRIDMTVEAYLASGGSSLEDLAKSIVKDGLIDELANHFSSSGSYGEPGMKVVKVEGNNVNYEYKLQKNEMTMDGRLCYTAFEGDTLTITLQRPDEELTLFPMVLKKMK